LKRGIGPLVVVSSNGAQSVVTLTHAGSTPKFFFQTCRE